MAPSGPSNGTTSTGRTSSSMLRNIRLPGTGGARPDSSQGENRPPSARASVVDRLRKMTLSGGSQPSRTTSGAAATRASPALGSRGVNGVSAAGPRTGGVSPPTVPRPPSSGAMSSAAANGVVAARPPRSSATRRPTRPLPAGVTSLPRSLARAKAHRHRA